MQGGQALELGDPIVPIGLGGAAEPERLAARRSRQARIVSSRLALGNSRAVWRRSASTPNAMSAIRISARTGLRKAGVGPHATSRSTIRASPP